jgi:hypothetical protein
MGVGPFFRAKYRYLKKKRRVMNEQKTKEIL